VPIICNAASYAYSPTLLTGVLNQTHFDISISYLGSADSRNLAKKSMLGWELGCGIMPKLNNENRWLQNITVYRASVADQSKFSITANNITCVLNIYTSCGSNLTSLVMRNNFTGISAIIPSGNWTLPLTSAGDVAAAVTASKTALADPNVPAANKLSTIANLASNLQSLASVNSTNNNTVLQSSSNDMLQQLTSIVAGCSSSDIASQAASVIGSVQSLISTGSTSASSVAQAASVLSSVLGSVASTSSIGSFSVASGNSVAGTLASILQSPSSSNGNASIVSSLDLLSKIAGSQATLANPITYADPSGLVLISASVSYPSSLASVSSGNSSINTGSAFTSFLATVATTTVTSRAVSLAINPYSAVTADSVNSTRTGVFQFSLFDDSNNPISVQNLASNFSMTFAMSPGMWTPAFPNATVVPACQYWNETQSKWQTDGCYFDTVNSNSTVGVCNCNHLTAFSVSLSSIAPNTLDPASDGANATHAGVIYLVTGFMAAIWMISVYYSWYTNRKSVLSQNGLGVDDLAAYTASIKTDMNPHSSTSARTYLTIHGSNARTECMMFAHGMKAGSRIEKTLIALNVGSIQSVTLSHDGTGAMTDWKVSEIVIRNVATGNGLIIDTPFAVPQAGLELTATRTLQGESTFFKRFRSQILVNIQDRHLWLSTVTAPTASRFSHTERLAVCFLLLFGNMGLGFWWHKTRSFTQDFVNVIIVAIITSAIMLFITLPLMFVLRSAQTTYIDFEADTERHVEGKSGSKKGPSVAWRYFAWTMLVLLTMCALALCALSALTLDANNVSALAAALQSCAISVAESLFISSPFVAILRSWWQARKSVEAFESSVAVKKTGGFSSDDRVIQASSTMEQQWNGHESIYPSIERTQEPPIESNNLDSAIMVTNSRNTNVRAKKNDFLGV